MSDPLDTLETPRLLLRPLSFGDVPALFDAIDSSRKHLAPWLPWQRGVGRADDLRVFVDRTMRENRAGAGHRALFEKDGRLAGHMSIEDVNAELRTAEFGYWVREDRAGKGYATEAARALLAFAFRTLDLRRVTAFADLMNAGSVRVLEKCGFVKEGVMRQRGWSDEGWRDHAMYGLLEGELRSA